MNTISTILPRPFSFPASKPLIFYISLSLCFIFISCSKQPLDQDTLEKSSINLILTDLFGTAYEGQYTDSAGKVINIAIVFTYPEHIKITHLRIFDDNDSILRDSTIILYSTNDFDTAYIAYQLISDGKIIATAEIDDGTLKSDTAQFKIIPSPQINDTSIASIHGNRIVAAGDLCTLEVVFHDNSSDQAFNVLITHNDTQTTLIQNRYIWRVPADASGSDTLLFSVIDTNDSKKTFVDSVIITITDKIPQTPTLLHVRSRDSGSITLKWNESTGAESYQIYQSSSSTSGFTLYKDSVKATTYIDSLHTQLRYYFIKAQNNAGLSDSSNIISSEDAINSAPQWNIQDTLKVVLQQDSTFSLNLADRCTDPENDTIHFSLLNNSIAGDTIIGTTLSVTAPDSGTESFITEVMAIDHYGSSDTLRIAFTVDAIRMHDSTPPDITIENMQTDTLVLTQHTVTLNFVVTDQSGISLIECKNDTISYSVTKTSDTTFTCIISGLAPNVYTNLIITATDSSAEANSSEKSIYVKYKLDHTGPEFRQILPLTDSATTNIDAFPILIICKDPSGVATISCNAGDSTYNFVKSNDTIFTTKISGLVLNQFTPVTITATDGSPFANTSTLVIYLKYDPTMTDQIGPKIILQAPAMDSSITGVSSATIELMCTDQSNIASVICSIGTREFPLEKGTSNNYMVHVTGLAEGANTLTFTATDSSTNANTTTLQVVIIYDPTATDSTAPVINLKSPHTNGSPVIEDSVTIQIACSDENGIASVLCTYSGSTVAVIESDDSLYSVKIANHAFSKDDTITFIATDKSINANSDTQDVVIHYTKPTGAATITLNTTPLGSDISSNILNFPVLIRLNPGNFNYFSQTLAGGSDIRFTKSDGTILDFEIERWTDNPGDADTAEIWVKVDTIYGNSATQSITMHWGKSGIIDSSDAQAVFGSSNNFSAVWHLAEEGNTTAYDATSFNNDGKPISFSSSADVSGAIGVARKFDGKDDCLQIGNNVIAEVLSTGNRKTTLSFWVKADATEETKTILWEGEKGANGWGDEHELFLSFGRYNRKASRLEDDYLTLYIGDRVNQPDGKSGYIHANTAYSDVTNWHYAAVTISYSRSSSLSAILYLDGTPVDTSNTSNSVSLKNWNHNTIIGRPYESERYFDGIIDEVRIADDTRSPDWIKLCYKNQKSNQTMLVPGEISIRVDVTLLK